MVGPSMNDKLITLLLCTFHVSLVTGGIIGEGFRHTFHF